MSTPIVPFYDSAARRFRLIEEIRELFRYRDLLKILIINSLLTRYKRSVLGVVWTLLNPLLLLIILAFVFSEVFRNSIERYPVYLLSGLIFWQFFSQTTSQASNSLAGGATLLKRIYIPRSLFVVVATGNGIFNLVASLILLVVVMLLFGQPFHLTWWFLPVAVLLLSLFTLGVSLFLSALAVQFTDVVPMYQMVLQIWFWFTPIMYPKAILPSQFVWLINFNPLFHLLELFRVPLYDGWLPGPNTFTAAAGLALLALLGGWWFFMWRADKIVYHL